MTVSIVLHSTRVVCLCVSAGWHADQRDPDTGAPVENKDKFPNGIKGVADQIHSMGLKVRFPAAHHVTGS